MIKLPRLPMPGVPHIDPPRKEGVVKVGRRRALGYAEFGVPDGRLILWHHGTPGGRRQIPLKARQAAEKLGIRLVCVERPGVGDSTNHRYRCIRDWADDAQKVVDYLGHDQFIAAGLSGGGPYALACAHEMPDRVRVVGLLGSVSPVAGPEAAPGASIVALSRRFQGFMDPLRTLMGPVLWGVIQPLMPLGNWAYGLYASTTPEGDKKVFADPDIKAMFLDDIANASRRRFGAVMHDAALFGRPWGFNLADIDTPVYWWHGDADNLVPVAHAEHSTELLQSCEYFVRPEESHLGGFGVADMVVQTLAEAWDRAPTV
jgi:pimeloyl-ACP methyl ester carboxylesterase